MVALYGKSDAKSEPPSQNAGPPRRTSARLKKMEAQTPTAQKRTASTPNKIGRRAAKKPKLESPHSDDQSQVMVENTHPVSVADNLVGDALSAEGNEYAMVTETLRTFNKYYLHFVQVEEKRCAREEADKERKPKKGSKSKKKVEQDDYSKKPSKRPDLKAVSEMMKLNATLYTEKRIGPIPGFDVGHQFFSRAEMVVVGFHQHWLNGIDFIGQTAKKSRKILGLDDYKLPLAVSIVLSGQYEDDLDNCNEIVYTGQGGNNLLGDKRQISDQVMKRGNLGLKNCMEQSVPVRVVRGHKCQNSYVGKVYTYDGLYKVVNYWADKGVSGFTVYKFRLKRIEGQPPLTTEQVHFTRGRIPNSISEIRGLVCEDITGGLEDIPIPVTNLVDDPPISPAGFTYIKDLKFGKNISVHTDAPLGCNCRDTCVDPRSCACAKLNGGDFPYVQRDGGRLVEPKAVVFECGPNCGCGPKCVNRTSQKGPRYRLEVFRTPNKGWGVRSWDYIPSGAPVCEYIGLLKRTDDLDPAADNSYVFDIDCLQTMKGLEGRESRLGDVSLPSYMQKVIEEVSESVPFCIDAGCTGNIARFINHSCQPNLFVQCVLSNHHDIKIARVILVAADNIPPLKELSYDYAYALDSVLGPDGKVRQMACHCGAQGCRKRLY
ncbi:histone H3 (Lys9) methyltransferase SUV39H1/Clr4, required for transcriptional silencing [Handroanthus impetiginosus]|uniref:Histone H3 (Lys9) methyltransferase SUV39H1/Clr4, required for transcriptional silencing n=1 Tax=Handroanthus impetiginosus TaxID=429701 RepID=A0A2G9I388_9LAMI|nr:histone H3 (Lys9) methyltransferase SUV39H1/Clr4, required for transcriptional silencing [Handroanthus impetiginosus]